MSAEHLRPEQFDAFLDGEPAARAEALAHLGQCPACAAELQRLAQAEMQLDRLVRSARPTASAKPRRRWPRVAALGAAAALLLVTLFRGMGPADSFETFCEDKTVFKLGSSPTADCFGNIQNGHYTPDKVQFTFDFPVIAGRTAIATLHFTAGSVQRDEQVEIAVNTVRMGVVDRSFGDDMRGQDISLVTKHLKPNDKNLLVFDNLKNPPGNEPWKICKVWVEVEQLPTGSPQELRDEARKYLAMGDRKFEDRYIGSSDVYGAWRDYKTARLYLEALDERGDDYAIIQGNIQKCERELNEQCAKIMLKGAAAERTGKEDEAIKIYKGGLISFPDATHPCYGQLKEALGRLE